MQYGKSSMNDGECVIYLLTRDMERGRQALKSLTSEPEVRHAGVLKSDGGLVTIKVHQLDITNPQSVADFVEFLKLQHPLGVDFAINNAAIALTGDRKSPHFERDSC